MQRFRNVLVYPSGLHPQEPSIATATEIARKTGARLRILSVVEPNRASERERAVLLRRKQRRRRAVLDRLVTQLGKAGVSARPVLLTGTSGADLVVAEVRRSRCDLVIKTARDDENGRRGVFGSVAARLLRDSPCPVWISRVESDPKSRVILAAISPRHEQTQLQDIDHEVLDIAAQLAEIRNAQLHVVSVWRGFAARILRGSVSYDKMRAELVEAERNACRELQLFLTSHRSPHASAPLHLHQGNIADVISRTAEELEAELVVVGSAGRTGLSRWLHRNTAEDVLAQTRRALLGVRAVGARTTLLSEHTLGE